MQIWPLSFVLGSPSSLQGALTNPVLLCSPCHVHILLSSNVQGRILKRSGTCFAL